MLINLFPSIHPCTSELAFLLNCINNLSKLKLILKQYIFSITLFGLPKLLQNPTGISWQVHLLHSAEEEMTEDRSSPFLPSELKKKRKQKVNPKCHHFCKFKGRDDVRVQTSDRNHSNNSNQKSLCTRMAANKKWLQLTACDGLS